MSTDVAPGLDGIDNHRKAASWSKRLPTSRGGEIATTIELIRSTEPEKAQQITNVRNYQAARNALALEPSPPGRGQGEGTRSDAGEGSNKIASQIGAPGLSHLQSTARDRKNIFAMLMEAVKTHSLGQRRPPAFSSGTIWSPGLL